METHRLRRLYTWLGMAVLFLAACQPAVLKTSIPLTETAVAAAPTGIAPKTTPSGESSGQPTAGVQVPEGWQVFTGSFKTYSLAYPPEWNVCESHQYSRIFCEIQKEPSGLGPPLRLYVSVYPQDYTNSDFEVYNFLPLETIQNYMALPVGGSMRKEPGALPEYFTYTRLPDQKVAGSTALVMENSRVWEFPSGTKERQVIIVTEGKAYIVGMYYQTPEQLEMFNQVVDSFQLVP